MALVTKWQLSESVVSLCKTLNFKIQGKIKMADDCYSWSCLGFLIYLDIFDIFTTVPNKTFADRG